MPKTDIAPAPHGNKRVAEMTLSDHVDLIGGLIANEDYNAPNR